MNGLIFVEVKKYAKSKLPEDIWEEVLRASGSLPWEYIPTSNYEDEKLVLILTQLSEKMAVPLQELLEDFGEFIAPDLVEKYDFLLFQSWKTMDLIANTEKMIHEVLRSAGTNVNPPVLECEKIDSNNIVVTYASPRKMCSLAKGLAKGVAKHYGESVAIKETSCMLKGDKACKLRITVS